MDKELSDLIKSIAELGALSMIFWLVRRVFTVTIPRLASDFKQALEKQEDIFRHEMAVLRDTFKDELREQRKDFREEIKAERETLGRRIDDLCNLVRTAITKGMD
jgi:gas vesicle protein